MGYQDDIQEPAFASVLGTSALPASPPASSGGSLQSMLGLDDNQMQRLSGGLGAGLTAAANNWNKPGLAAFAGGAGGALQGSSQAQQQQVDNRLKAVQAALQAWQAGDIGALRRAQAEYYRAMTPAVAARSPQSPEPATAPPPANGPMSPANRGFGPPAIQYGSPSGQAQPQLAAPVNPVAFSPSPIQTASSATDGFPSRPAGVPFGAAYSPSRNKWRSSDGRYFDSSGQQVSHPSVSALQTGAN